jgi:UDP-N-acetylmuramoyl-tripeptide--D-alanyl-D-alanine ligase
MDFRSLTYLAEACGGVLLAGSPRALVNRVISDSRHARSGDLFFALAGERFDGHDFFPEVAQKGVTGVVADGNRVPSGLNCGVIAVDNPRLALGRLAARYRGDFNLPVVAVGGSNGKTTTKELVATVLRQKFRTLWSEASFNNDIGVPMTLLKLEQAHQVAVLEVGTNHPGELAPLVRMIGPRFGIITSIGREHLDFFGDITGVVQEEGWLAELLPVDGKIFLNGDSEQTESITKRTRSTVVRVGMGAKNDWRVTGIQMDVQGSTFQLNAPQSEYSGEYHTKLLGNHQVVNAVFAIAVGAAIGLDRTECHRGLAEAEPAKMRLETWNWNGVCVLDDAYNANADSMVAALGTLRQLPCAGRRVAVLGDMAELGSHSLAAHEEVGRRAAELGVYQLFAVGKMAEKMAGAARAAGMKNVMEFPDAVAAVDAVRQFLKAGDVMLLKASRATRLERLSEGLKSAT